MKPTTHASTAQTDTHAPPRVVVLTVSDRCHRGEARDTAGPAVVACLRERLAADIVGQELVADERPEIADRLRRYADTLGVDLVLTVGGTGPAPRDITPEATRDVLERLTPGFDEAMRLASAAKTPTAMLSRAVSGIRGATFIINLPGSERAAVENLEAILPALPHGIEKLRGHPGDCACCRGKAGKTLDAR